VTSADSTGSPTVTVDRVTATDLDRVRQLVTQAAREAGLDQDRADRLTLAVNEVATNAIQHATGTARVTIRTAGGHLLVDVEDAGPGIPAQTTRPDLPAPEATGGRGLWLARQFCDRVEIVTGPGGTRVRLLTALPGR
jgi:anti-sigma regulatory factor (Ser/Thr protein kinase)